MDDPNKPDSTDPQGSGVKPGGGGTDVEAKPSSTSTNSPNQPDDGKADGLIDTLKEVTGREFKDLDDFTKHYKNLSSYVGKKGQEEPEEPDNQPEANKPEGGEPKKLESEIQAINKRLEESDFLRKHPDAEKNLDLVKQTADHKGVSLEDAYSDDGLQELLKDLEAGREQRETETSVESNNRVGVPESDVSDELKQKAMGGDPRAREELVRKMVYGKKD